MNVCRWQIKSWSVQLWVWMPRFERRCMYSWERTREIYPFRISIRFFARHHTVFSDPATALCLPRCSGPRRYALLPATCLSVCLSRRRVFEHVASLGHLNPALRLPHHEPNTSQQTTTACCLHIQHHLSCHP